MDPGEAWVSTLAEADGKKQGILSQLSHTWSENAYEI